MPQLYDEIRATTNHKNDRLINGTRRLIDGFNWLTNGIMKMGPRRGLAQAPQPIAKKFLGTMPKEAAAPKM